MSNSEPLPDLDPGALEHLADGTRRDPGGTPNPVAEAEKLRYIAVPTPVDGMLYGPLGQWAREATAESEASVQAVFMNFATYVGVCVGRDVEFRLGDTPHHPRLFWLQVGRTGRGRKGTAAAPVERLQEALETIDEVAKKVAGGDAPRAVAPDVHLGGLSTREGLAWKIRDPVKGVDENGNEKVLEPGVTDKRLFVVESEFENVLAQAAREGNTLSSGLRDCWDGRDLAPLTKTNRTRASDPHVGLVAHITPAELLALLEDRQITNGFLNRFLVIWAERTRLVPLPEPTPQETVNAWANALNMVVARVRADRPRMHLSDDARKAYTEMYKVHWADPSGSDLVRSLLERSSATALRLSMILALMDHSADIEVQHLKAAELWVRYWQQSVEYIWRDRENLSSIEAADSRSHAHGEKIIDYLRKRGKAAFRTELIKECFKGHIRAPELDAALQDLQLRTPPAIRVEDIPKQRRPCQTATSIRLAH